MREFNKFEKNVIKIIALITALVITGLYFFMFNDGLSNSQSDWGAFGGYIGGIAAIANVFVFIWLTLAIQKSGKEERLKELNHQRMMIITQMRYNELAKFTEVLNSALIIDGNMLYHLNLLNVEIEILAFLKSRENLFTLLNEDSFKKKLLAIHELIYKMRKICQECAGIDEKGHPTLPVKNIPIQFTPLASEYDEAKSSIISELENYILENMNTPLTEPNRKNK